MEKIIIRVDSYLEDIVPGFIENRRNEMPVIVKAIATKDYTTLQTLGHRLKGNAGGYGFDQMGVIGGIIEKEAINKDITKIESAASDLEDFLNRLEIIYVNE